MSAGWETLAMAECGRHSVSERNMAGISPLFLCPEERPCGGIRIGKVDRVDDAGLWRNECRSGNGLSSDWG